MDVKVENTLSRFWMLQWCFKWMKTLATDPSCYDVMASIFILAEAFVLVGIIQFVPCKKLQIAGY